MNPAHINPAHINPHCPRCWGTGQVRLRALDGILSAPCPACTPAPPEVEAAFLALGYEIDPDPEEVARAKARHAAVEIEALTYPPCPECRGGGIVWEDGGRICSCWSWRAK